MTAGKTTPTDRCPPVDEILETVRSIDRNVEEILDRFSDHIEDQQYRHEWQGREYGIEPGEYDPD